MDRRPNPEVILESALGWDLAVRGNTAFVAHGFFGVGVYDISNPANLKWRDQIFWLGKRFVTVAASENLVAAGTKKGKVFLHRISKEMESVGEIDAQGRISKVDFHNGLLWVLGKHDAWVEVYDVTDPEDPVKMGEITTGAEEYFRGRFMGPRAYTFEGKNVKSYRFEADGEEQ